MAEFKLVILTLRIFVSEVDNFDFVVFIALDLADGYKDLAVA